MRVKSLLVFLLGIGMVASNFNEVYAQQTKQRVAIYVPKGNSENPDMPKYAKFLATELQIAVARSAAYDAIERTGKFLELLKKEQAYQATGEVDDNKLAELGKQEGVDFILSVDLIDWGNNTIYAAWKLINVESAIVQDGDSEIKEISNMVADLKNLSANITQRISGGASVPVASKQVGSVVRTGGQNYVESTWGLNMEMVYVEGGSFVMGCTSEQGGECDDDESPTRRVSMSSYYIGATEVTQGQWEKVMGTSIAQQRNKVNPEWTFKGTGPDYPMYYVNWEEAMTFCRELSRQTGKKYSLPTEAQWEYAARGGNRNEGTKYSGSHSIDVVAWYKDNCGGINQPVKTKRPNVLGLYDMSGNVYEWCKDWKGTYNMNDTQDPQGPTSGSRRVERGGSRAGDVKSCRVSNRNSDAPSDRYSNVGFRVVMIP